MSIKKEFYRLFAKELEYVSDALKNKFKDELQAQGHVLTGKLINSIDYEIDLLSENIVSAFYFEDYGFIVNDGVKAEKIPFSPGSGKKTSKYIDALVNFFKLRGILDEKKALSRAFATAYAHKRAGMPTRGSFAYSNNGRRTGFVNRTVLDESDKIFQLVDKASQMSIETSWYNMLDEMTYKFSKG